MTFLTKKTNLIYNVHVFITVMILIISLKGSHTHILLFNHISGKINPFFKSIF